MPAKLLESDTKVPPPPDFETATKVQVQNPLHRSEHKRTLETPKGHKWFTLTVNNRSPNPTALPIFFDGDAISGKVELDLEKSESIKGVVVSVVAANTFVGQDEDIFLRQEQEVWTPPAQGGSKMSAGKHSWPFSIELPAEVLVKERDKQGTLHRLPPSFMERASPAYLDYKLVVTIKRGMLKVNQTLMTNLVYIPITYAEPPSHLRRMAYMDGSPLLGPDVDPDGWKALPTVKLTGTLFNTRTVTVECTVSLGSPLSYAVGTPIPIYITFRSEDPQALDTLSQPSSVRLRLQRSMSTGSEAVDDNGVRRTDNHFLENTAFGYFWRVRDEDPAQSTTRVLEGELELGKDLKQSFKFPRFAIRYQVQLLLPSATSFVPDPNLANADGILASERVTITSRQAPGVVTHSYAPPGYEKPQPGDYNNSVGLLEIGNQRFVHYGHHG